MSQTQTAPLDPDLLVYGMETPLDPQVCPDGSRVLYRLVSTDREADAARSRLVVRGWEGGEPLQLTGAGAVDGCARWSPDGRQVAFVTDRAPTQGVFVVSSDGGEPRELVRHRWPIAGLAWSPDGTHLAYTTRVDAPGAEPPADGRAPAVRVTSRPDYKIDGVGFVGDARSQVFVVDVAGGCARQLTRAERDLFLPQWSPDARTLALVMGTPGPARLALLRLGGGDIEPVGPEGGPVPFWSWSPSGDRIVFAADPDRTYQSDLYLYEPGTGRTTRLTEDLAMQPMATGHPVPQLPSTPVWLDDDRVAFAAVRHGVCGIYVLSCISGEVELLHDAGGGIVAFSIDGARRRLVIAACTFEHPTELHAVELDSGRSRPLTGHACLFPAAHPLAGWERLEVTRGGETIEGWLLRPPDFDPSRRYPLVLDVHGGPNGFYGTSFVPLQQCLATHGFLVLFCNPRGSVGYGRRFTGLVFRDWGGEDFADLMAMLDEAVSRPYVDPDRLGIHGYSYGGYMTSWTIGHTNRFRAAVCGAPCFDIASHWGTADIGDVWDEVQWGGPPHERAEWFRDRSPSTHAHHIRTPTLVLQGEADDRCPVGQGHHLYTALHNAGCETELALYPGASHLFIVAPEARPSQRADYLARSLRWFQCHLAQPDG